MGKQPPFSILFEDENILVLNKPSGLSVLPERWEREQANLLEMVRETHPEATSVHRIDKETSGLLLMALNPEAARKLQIDFEARRIGKFYHALVFGRPSWATTVCTSPLVVDGDRLHRSVPCSPEAPGARNCESRFSVLTRFRSHTLTEVELLSGRTHQIRAHAAFLGLPIVGDHLYGGPKNLLLSAIKPSWKGDRADEQPLIARVALHAQRILFAHPITGEALQFEAEYPKDLRATFAQLARNN